MKTLFTLLAALLCFAGISSAQTSSTDWLTPLGNAISTATNWAVVTGAGRATTGNRDLAFAAVAYNFNNNVGVVLGEDYLWSKGQASQQNALKGGVTLSATIHPLAFVGSTFLTNVVGTPFISGLASQPVGGSSANIGTIAATGIEFSVATVKNFNVILGLGYENRTGSGFYDGHYGLATLGLKRSF